MIYAVIDLDDVKYDKVVGEIGYISIYIPIKPPVMSCIDDINLKIWRNKQEFHKRELGKKSFCDIVFLLFKGN